MAEKIRQYVAIDAKELLRQRGMRQSAISTR